MRQVTYGRKDIRGIWHCMMNRCNDPKNNSYKNYGARGIKVCKEWQTLDNFFFWCLENGWRKGLQLDRINNNKNYCPKNCRFVTGQVNSNNKRTNKFIRIEGMKMTIAEAYRAYGHHTITPQIVRHRLLKGEKPIAALTTPLKISRKRNQSNKVNSIVIEYLKNNPSSWKKVEEYLYSYIEYKQPSYVRNLLSSLKRKGVLINKDRKWFVL